MNGTIIDFTKENHVKIQMESGQIIEFPREILPLNTIIGNKLYIDIQTEETHEIHRQDFNKNLLNQILKV